MSDTNNLTTDLKMDPRCREARPERIDIGTDILVRNDVLAREHGMTRKTIDRGDALGAPYTMVAHTKYRPLRAYQQFLANQIQIKNQPPKRRPRSRTRRR
ncbi:MAG: hypothetical protein ACLP02_07540 [Rhodomicrobium sp.]